MSLHTQIATCNEQYRIWKDKAFLTKDVDYARRAMEKAFFWLELRSAFMSLMAVERTSGNDREIKSKLLTAKINLSKKLTEYLREIANELA